MSKQLFQEEFDHSSNFSSDFLKSALVENSETKPLLSSTSFNKFKNLLKVFDDV